MKKCFLVLTFVSVVLWGCGSGSGSNSSASSEPSLAQSESLTVMEVMEMAEGNLGEEVLLKGLVTHVCSHSGKRVFISSEDGSNSIRVEAKGRIGGFNRELEGSRIVVKGTIQERRLDAEFIAKWEARTQEALEQASNDDHHCSADLNNIRQMKEWMSANNKDFYSVYFLDGVDYEELN